MRDVRINLSAAALAVILAAPLAAFALETGPDQGLAAAVPALDSVLMDSRLAASAEDAGTMRGFAARSFAGLKTGGSAAPVVSESGEGAAAASGAAARAAGEGAGSTIKAAGNGLSAKVPALAADVKGDNGNIAHIYIEKGLKYGALAVAGAALVGGAVAGGLLLGGAGVVIGVAAGAVVLGVVASKVLHSFWNSF